MKKSLSEQAATATLHCQAARRLRCARCGLHPRQPPFTTCSLCRSQAASRAAALGWRRRHRWLAQWQREIMRTMTGPPGDLARAIDAARDIDELTALRVMAVAIEGRARARNDADDIDVAVQVRRFADKRISDLRRAVFGFRSTRP